MRHSVLPPDTRQNARCAYDSISIALPYVEQRCWEEQQVVKDKGPKWPVYVSAAVGIATLIAMFLGIAGKISGAASREYVSQKCSGYVTIEQFNEVRDAQQKLLENDQRIMRSLGRLEGKMGIQQGGE
jgi:hypothetical protein